MPQVVQRLTLSKSNAFLLMGDKPILIDSGSPGDLSMLERKLQNYGVRLDEIELLILTHAHFDHAGNAAAIRKCSGCKIVAHKLEQPFVECGKNAAIVPVHLVGQLMNPFMNIPFTEIKVDIVLEDTLDLKPFGVDAQVLFTPGHTPGSISVVTGQGDAVVGDLVGGGLLLGMFQSEKPRYHYWASSMDEVRKSLKALFSQTITQIHVGHGGPLDGTQAYKFFFNA
jgi:hydroxyacylglutathione hydrolase